MASDAHAALAAVLRQAEGQAIAELRAALAEARRAAAEAVAQLAAERAAWHDRRCMLEADAHALAVQAREAGLEGELLDEYAPRQLCVVCDAEAPGQPWSTCEACLAPLLSRGWRRIGGEPYDQPRCETCNEYENCGVIGGRTRCVPCALHFLSHFGLQ